MSYRDPVLQSGESTSQFYEVTYRPNSQSVDAYFRIDDSHVGPFTIGPETTKAQAIERAVKLFILCDVNSCHRDVIAILSAGVNEVSAKWGCPSLAEEAKAESLMQVMHSMYGRTEAKESP